MKKVVIIGGGITGLTAAYTIHQARQKGEQIDYLLVEKETRLGGKIVTETIDGFVVEGGPDCFLAEKPSALQLSSQIGIEDRLLPSNENSAGTYIFCDGKLQKLPDGLMLLVPNKILPFVVSPLISWPGKFRMALDFFLPKKKEDTDETLAGFVNRRMGKEALDKIAEPMIGGIHGGDPDTMSLKASFPRFLKMEQDYGGLALAMLAGRWKMAQMKRKAKANPQPAGKLKKTYFMSYKNGMAELIKGIADQLEPGKVLIGNEVTKIEKKVSEGKNSYVVYINGMEPVESDAVIMAAPSNVTSELFASIDGIIAINLGLIPMASSASISLAYKKSDITKELEAFGFVIPYVEGRKINAVTYTSIKWDHRVPNDEYILIRSFVGKPRNQGPAELSEKEIEKVVRAELADVLGITAEPQMVKVHKWVKARPQYVMGHLERIKEVDDKLANEHKGMFIAGACYHGIGVPDCINDGTKAGEAALAYLK